MISERIITAAAGLERQLAELFPFQVKYQLDFSWPSIGVLDLLLTPIRSRESLTQSECELLFSVSAYIGGLVHDCWSGFTEPPELQLVVEEEEIVLIAKGGMSLRREQVRLNISRAVMQTLRHPLAPLPYYNKEILYPYPGQNLLSPLVIGFLTTLSPWIEGTWKDQTPTAAKLQLIGAQRFCSMTSARYYQRIFPTESLGSNIALYQSNLILPPAGYDEMFLFSRGAHGLANYLKELDLPHDSQLLLALNLAYSPDPLISASGFAVAAALSSCAVTSQLELISESLAPITWKLRPAVLFARRGFGLPGDFQHSIENDRENETLSLIDADRKLNLLPLMILRDPMYLTKQYQPILNALAWNEAASARALIDNLNSPSNIPLELRLQGIYLDLARMDLSRAQWELHNIAANEISSAKLHSLALSLYGLLATQLKDTARAITNLKTALLVLPAEEIARRIEITELLALNLLSQSNFDECLDVIDALGKEATLTLSLRLQRAQALRMLKRDEDTEQDYLSLTRAAPFCRKVYEAFMEWRCLRDSLLP